jgi:hypothetical protein
VKTNLYRGAGSGDRRFLSASDSSMVLKLFCGATLYGGTVTVGTELLAFLESSPSVVMVK